MSISEQFDFRLPPKLEESLGDSLNQFLDLSVRGQNTSCIKTKDTFIYKLLRSPNFLKSNKSYIGGIFADDILTITLGDTVLCVLFNSKTFLPKYRYYNLTAEIRSAKINDGTNEESYQNICKEKFAKSIKMYIKSKSEKISQLEWEKANKEWHDTGLNGNMPKNAFIELEKKVHGNGIKAGDKITKNYYNEMFSKIVAKYKPRTKKADK